MTTVGPPPNGAPQESREHLAGDQLNRYVDGDLSTAERRAADLHLSTCDRCAAELADLIAISSLLGSSMPQVRVPRSFHLDSSHVRTTSSFWHRFGAALLPALPAMRAGTIAVALAFASVTAYRVVDDEPRQSEDNAMITQPTASLLVSTATMSTAGRVAETVEIATEIMATEAGAADLVDSDDSDAFIEEEEGSGSSAEVAPSGGENESADQAPDTTEATSDEPMDMFEAQEGSDADEPSLESDAANLEIAQSAPVGASPTAEPTSTATATVTLSPTATPTSTALATAPTPLPTDIPAPVAEDEADDPSWLGRAQLVLGVMLALLGGLVVGVQRLRKKVTG